MTVDMKLDAHAVRALIGDNETFRLELQSAVIQEITRKMFDKSIPEVISQMVSQHHTGAKEALMQALSDEVNLNRAVDAAMTGMIKRVQQRGQPYMAGRELSDEVKEMISRRVSVLITEQVDKRVKELDKVIGDMAARIEKRVSDRMEGRVDQIDQAYHDACMKAVMEKFVQFSTN